jgi:TatD DNase family protein
MSAEPNTVNGIHASAESHLAGESYPLFDSHCHLDDACFDADRGAVILRAQTAGVQRCLVPGVHPREWPRLVALRAQWDGVRLALGVHPHALAEMGPEALRAALDALPQSLRDARAVAVGEVGLDGLVARREDVSLEVQIAVLDAHIEIARSCDRPLVLHVVRAHEAALRALARHGLLRGVVHAYSGPAELVPAYLARGLHLGFAGVVTRLNAHKAQRAVCAVPRERLLIETDAPSQAPVGADTTRAEPAQLPLTLRAIADLRGESFDTLARVTTENAQSLFA